MNTKPQTTFDKRRYLALVQVLTLEDNKVRAGILHLCEQWEIHPEYKGTWFSLDFERTISKLARHVVEYHRKENDHAN